MTPQTFEQNGHKYKLQIVLSVVVIVLGFALLIFAGVSNIGDFGYYVTAIALVNMAAGAIWLAILKFLAWWHRA